MGGKKFRSLALLLTLLVQVGHAQSNDAVLERGKYLTAAADCMACHTLPDQPAFSGGNAFKTPFGIIYAPNITADVETGIGAWTDAEFLRALHQGIGKDGEYLYPAFPYTQFTRISDDDVLAIKAYLLSLPAVRRANQPNELRFPYNIRSLLWAWNLFNFDAGRFTPDPARSAAYNRGQYLAEALGHCNECHTPRNFMFGLDHDRHLGGGVVDGWQAFNITPDPVSGIGNWSSKDIVTYLSTGHLRDRASAAGPMAEVVSFSLRFLSAEDLQALAVYLKEQRPVSDTQVVKSRNAYGAADGDRLSFSTVSADSEHTGRALYVAACASCHTLAGTGLQAAHNRTGGYPGLIGSSVLGFHSADNLVLTILHGVERQGADEEIYMPPFGPKSRISNAMSDAEIATLTNYLVQQFGNPRAVMTADRVRQLRMDDVAGSSIGLLLLGVAAGVVAIAAFWFWWRTRWKQ